MNVANPNIAAGQGLQPANGQFTHPSWTVKRGWSIINIDKKQFVPFEIPRNTKYVTTVRYVNGQYQEVQRAVLEPEEPPAAAHITSGHTAYDYSEVIWPLSEPVLLPLDEVAQYVKATAGYHSDTKGLHKLPYDIQLHIFNSVEDAGDATKLCVAHPTLLQVGYKRIAELAPERWAPWAGDRLLALPGKQEEPFWIDVRTAPPECLSSDDELMADIDVAGGFIPYLETYRRLERSYRCPDTLRDVVQKIPAFDLKASSIVNICHRPAETAYVVCNISKREYVRTLPGLETIPAAPGHPGDRGTCKNGLPLRVGSTIPSRIYCSSSNSGSWAGDRIVVHPQEVAQSTFEDWPQWKDVTRRGDPAISFVH
ncbi:hypothetical protein PsYK624_064340 [Phanerochaete sordida]|uniref:Uncharacterized protein n=1 Tax=Phanerochaete sordida TaxID=48140 RepID=A0A9P3G9A8_9APHY|nr:hypothetical protein PsYK624_064340 [Phanerochaete sordida]